MPIFFLGFLLLLLSCTGKPSVPDGVLAEDKMVRVLFDVIRADELVDLYTINDSLYRLAARRRAVYDTIFHLHALSNETFQKSMRYYQDHPVLLKEVLDSVQQRIETDTIRKKVDTTAKPLKSI